MKNACRLCTRVDVGSSTGDKSDSKPAAAEKLSQCLPGKLILPVVNSAGPAQTQSGRFGLSQGHRIRRLLGDNLS